MKLSLFASLQRRLRWFNLPTAVLITVLQRSPAVRMVAAVEEMVTASPIGTLIKSIATAAAALGAVNSMAGATPLEPSAGTEGGITVTANVPMSVGYTANSPLGPAAAWEQSGALPPGLSFSSNGGSCLISGTPTTPGSYPFTLKAFGPNGAAAGEEVDYPYTITVQAGSGNVAPAITTQPASQTVSAGASVTFTVAASGTPAPTIQWKKGGADIAGATNTTLTLNNVQSGDAATYTAVATNASGSATSNGAVLTISAAATAPAFTTQPVSQSVTAGGTATFTVAVSGSPTPTLQWKKGTADVSGATSATLTLNNVQAADAATYTAVATNSAGSATSSGAVLTVTASSLPTIATQPAGHTVATGGSVIFNVEVTGGGLTYQWKKNGANLSGATSSQLLLTNAQAGDAASYTVTAANGSGSVTSAAAVLAVTATSDPGRIVNVSVRIVSGANDQVLIVGFVTGGAGTSGNKQLLIRGIGPTLGSFGVPSVLADPVLDIIPFGSSTPLVSNNDWAGNATVISTANTVGAFALPDSSSKDAALVANLSGGVYSAKVSGANNTTGTALAEIYDANPSTFNPATPRLVNVSARAQTTNDNPLIAGFVISGSTAKTVMIRAIGPTLTSFGVGSAMPDPELQLYVRQSGSDHLLLTNDNWGGSALTTSTGNSVGAFALPDGASKDAVLLVTLDPGVYSAEVLGISNASGIALVEIYDVP